MAERTDPPYLCCHADSKSYYSTSTIRTLISATIVCFGCVVEMFKLLAGLALITVAIVLVYTTNGQLFIVVGNTLISGSARHFALCYGRAYYTSHLARIHNTHYTRTHHRFTASQ
jgi:hypothetical protein